MASFYSVSIMAFLLLATGAFLASPGMAFQANEQDFAPPPESSSSEEDIVSSPDVHKFLEHCKNKLGKGCGPMVFGRIFEGKTKDMSTSCCQELVDMGLACHNALTNSIILRPEFSDKAALYHKNRVHVWKLCKLLI